MPEHVIGRDEFPRRRLHNMWLAGPRRTTGVWSAQTITNLVRQPRPGGLTQNRPQGTVWPEVLEICIYTILARHPGWFARESTAKAEFGWCSWKAVYTVCWPGLRVNTICRPYLRGKVSIFSRSRRRMSIWGGKRSGFLRSLRSFWGIRASPSCTVHLPYILIRYWKHMGLRGRCVLARQGSMGRAGPNVAVFRPIVCKIAMFLFQFGGMSLCN